MYIINVSVTLCLLLKLRIVNIFTVICLTFYMNQSPDVICI